jgi:hypothetical protein
VDHSDGQTCRKPLVRIGRVLQRAATGWIRALHLWPGCRQRQRVAEGVAESAPLKRLTKEGECDASVDFVSLVPEFVLIAGSAL